jgi:PPOX class probable F420-dependent enzyme
VGAQPRQPVATVAPVTDLGSERYISITTFRRDGTPVATPVWVVAAAGRLYVWTGSGTGKARRIRNNPDVTLAACTARGAVTGPAVSARAVIVPADQRPEIWKLLLAKYRLQLRALVLADRAQALLRRKQRAAAERIYLELTVATV